MSYTRYFNEGNTHNAGYIRQPRRKNRRYGHHRRRQWTEEKTVQAEDIQQGRNGTCYLLAAAVGHLKYRVQMDKWTNRPIRYEFKFQDERGIVNKVRIKTSKVHSTRFTDLVEIAYQRVRPNQDILNGGWEWNALSDITGRKTHAVLADTPDDLLNQADVGETIGVLAQHPDAAPHALVGDHAYSITEVTTDSLTMYNPWGIDGVLSKDGVNDGYVTMNRSELQQAMDSGVDFRLSNML